MVEIIGRIIRSIAEFEGGLAVPNVVVLIAESATGTKLVANQFTAAVVDTVFGIFNTIGVFLNRRIQDGRLVIAGQGLLHKVAESVGFIERRSHGNGVGAGTRVAPGAHDLTFRVVFTAVIDKAGSGGSHLGNDLPETVGQGLGENRRAVSQIDGFPQAIAVEIVGVVDFALSVPYSCMMLPSA